MKKRHLQLLTIILCLLISISLSPKEAFAATPAAPTNLTASTVSSSQISLTWNYVSDATSYYIYRSTSYNGSYSFIGSVASQGYVDNNLSPNTTYYYQIRAYNSSGYSAFSPIASASTLASSSSAGLTAVATGTGQIYLSWNSFNSATSYFVSRSTSYSGTYSRIATPSSRNYTDTGLSAGTTYYYRVEAVNSSGSSVFSPIVSEKTYSSSSSSEFKAEVTGSNQIYLSWPAVTSASYYRLSRSTSYSGPYFQLMTSNSTYYTDSSVLLGAAYYYKLEAISSSGSVISNSIVSATPYETSSSAGLRAVATSSNQIYLSWNSFNSASSYSISRSASSDGTYSRIATTSSTNYTDTGLSAGTTYYYRVEAVNSFGYSAFSPVVSEKTYSSSSSSQFTAEFTSSNQIYLSWPAVTSASYYRLSRSTSYFGPYSQLTTSNSTYYTDNNVVSGISYYYKLEALNSSGSVIYDSIASTASSSNGSSQIPNRLAGANRYETSKNICGSGWNTSYYAIIVSGENYPDALCSAPLAYKYNAPILLTSKSSLDSQTKAELTRLHVKKVFLIGGAGVISSSAEQAIKNMGITVSRIAGKDRYDTSLQIAQAIGQTSQAVITNGTNFPDVLSIAPIAALKGMPILLTSDTGLSGSLRQYLQNSVQKTYVLGGSNVISNGVYGQLPSPERISGANRYENNINIIKKFSDQLDFSTCYLATGESYPDALSGSVLAALSKSPLILVNSSLDQSTLNFIKERKNTITKMIAFGGTGAVPDSVLTNLSGSNSGSSLTAPANLAATCLNSSQIYLSWNAVSTATSYNIYRSTSSSGTYSYLASSNSTSYADTGLAANTTYYYKVMAVNSNGSSSYSSYASATTSSR